ncbi:unnamed protein product [Linum trigynum]|uniref:ADP-ribosyl cyclase/cyclic ADP-ribose hydrolase n=1 Tax=Linum trigynum TaxID=586398 RepID=A0AAV2FRY6_9ROSI
MSSAAAGQASSSSSSPASQFRYDVFLSFRGSDTRYGFVSHLYNALKEKGVSTFKDDQKLERGKLISPEILRVIELSRFSIVVFSKDYASSPWCLEELQIIIQCMEHENKSHTVIPVFYSVDPSDVGEVRNSYAASFAQHEMDFPDDAEMLRNWKAALKKAAELSGWDSRHKEEPALIQEIVEDVVNKLGRRFSNKPSGLVGIERRIKDMELLLSTGLVDVRVVGIWGMAGIEKRGLDHLRRKLLSALIAEDGLRILDKNLDVLMSGRLRNKCILVVLDDVSNVNQLTSLAGDRDWFGPGSRIIITSKDKHLLEQHEVDSVYEAKPLSESESLQLFCQHAFKKRSRMQEFMGLSRSVVNYARGLPLALQVLGSSLFNMDRGDWESKLKALEDFPPQDIVQILRQSFDVLDRSEKNIFLDVACFLKGEDEEYVVSILEGCGSSARYGLKVLLRKSLITIQDNKVWMHDLLQQMAREVVRQESLNEVGRRSRLWNHLDVCDVLVQNTGTKDVESIVLDLSKVRENMSLKGGAFHKMNRLRLLKICYPHHSGGSEYVLNKEPSLDMDENRGNDAQLSGKFKPLVRKLESLRVMDTTTEGSSRLHMASKLTALSNELRSLHWHGYPFESLPANFYPRNLVEFNLSFSSLKNLWRGNKVFDKMKYMKVSYSQKLTHLPDFSGGQNLEILILESCVKLIEVHPSVGFLRKLAYLNLKGCRSLLYLPPTIGMTSLETLVLSGCSKLNKFPELEGDMGRLSELLLDGTDISELPASIQKLTGLVTLSVTGCKRLEFIPEGVGHCRGLTILRLTGCENLRRVQFELSLLENLEEFHGEGTALELSHLIGGGYLKKLKVFTLRRSGKSPLSLIQTPRRDPFPVMEPSASVGSPHFIHYAVFQKLSSLTSLDLSYCNLPNLLCDLTQLACLTKLDLSGNHFTRLFNGALPRNLQVLIVSSCKNLYSIPTLPPATYCLEASNCQSLGWMEPPGGNESARMRGINLMNCLELGANTEAQVAVELIKTHAHQTPAHPVSELSIIIPGSKIVEEWRRYEHMHSMTTVVELPPEYHDYPLKGVALWVTFNVESFTARANLSLDFHFRSGGENIISEVGFVVSKGTEVRTMHMWLRFVPVLLFKSIRNRDYPTPVDLVIVTNSSDLSVNSCGLYPICQDQQGKLLDVIPSSTGL